MIKRLAIYIIIILLISSCASKETVKTDLDTRKVAIVLGAGASKGFAHVGVLKVLEANGIPIDMIVGTSAGSFVGSLYAYGLNAYELQKIALSITKSDIVDITIPDSGFIKGEKVEEFINKNVKNTPIERFKIPFYAVATDIITGKEVVFGRGNAGTAVRASCSIPGIFRPVKIANALYVDGGVVSPVAVRSARQHGATVVIAVDISGDTTTTQPEGILDTILKSIDIMYSRIAQKELEQADIVIKPKVSHISSSDFSKRHEAILEGEKSAQQQIHNIQSILKKK